MKQGIYGKDICSPITCGLLFMTGYTNLLTKNVFGNYNKCGD